MASFDLEDEEFVEAVNLLGEMLIRLSDMTPVMERTAERLEAMTKESIDGGTGPNGERWAPLAPATVEIYRKQGRTPGKLMGSLGGTLRRETQPLQATLISEHRAAGALLEGTDKLRVFGKGRATLPARPFITGDLPADTATAIEEDALDYVLGGWDE